ncbi:MAG: endonuclease MutS2 [Clostridia bacterium]|nr:endonuclease MutS2 [Clostridia bacterium]
MNKHLKTLEFHKVLELLSNQAALADAAEKARELVPAATLEQQLHLLDETTDAHMLLSRAGAPSFGGIHSVNAQLTKAALGGVLSMGELLDVADVLRTVRTIKEWKEDAQGLGQTSIDNIFEQLYPIKYLEEQITAAIKTPEEMNDNASPALADIRRKKLKAAADIRNKLDSLTRSKTFQKYLMEGLVTQRDGRYVVPVKAEFKGEVPGLVHDISASGSTLFVEPMAVVEINNDLKVLQAKERDEIERILSALSAEVSTFSEVTLKSYNALVELDLIFAKARLAFSMQAFRPVVNADGVTCLKRARHPLISKDKIVPIDISLGKEYDTLVITGPNTGGKTVSLKTLGLLTAMAMCGLMIPAAEGSEVSFFKNIMVDIGDEQSIEQSLSTFSSHMSNIADITAKADGSSLVLLDELGAGTDPVEGAALAAAVISHLRRCGAVIAATTHYAELKTFALDTPGVQNASCEFDVENLRPTYRLLIGVPGSSNAFAISERLNIAKSIIDEAKGLVSEDSQRFERVVAKLTESQRQAEILKEEAERIRDEALKLAADERTKAEKREEETRKIIKESNARAEEMIEKARRGADEILDSLEKLRREAKKDNAAEMLTQARSIAKGGIKELESGTLAPEDVGETYVPERPFQVGDNVVIADVNRAAVVAEIKGNCAIVACGAMKLSVPLSNLRFAKKKQIAPPTRTVSGLKSRAERSASAELDLRGFASDEGVLALDRFIDEALLSGVGSITIIHGKGTGVLRKAVHAHLRSHKSVRTFRLGTFGEGEMGVTIAELK